MNIGETEAALGEAIDVRGFYGGGSVAGGVAVAEVVGIDEDDVGLGVRRGGGEGHGPGGGMEERSAVHRLALYPAHEVDDELLIRTG